MPGKTAKPIRTSHILVGLAIAAFIGLSVFAVLAWRSVTVEHADTNEALRRFTEIRDGFTGTEPILHIDAAGRVTRSEPPEGEVGSSPAHLHALGYHASERRIVRADVPFWFLKVKGPAVQYSLRGTGLDLQRLGVTVGDLERYGPRLVLDETRTTGDRLLVWTE